MFLARVFARSRVWKLLVSLCALCAFAFVLGQGAAAVQLKLTQAAAPSAAASSRQISLPVAGAQGTTPTPSRAPASPVTFSTKKGPTASPGSQMRPLTSDAGHKGKGKHQTKHLKAAGDKSHGGLPHGGDPKSGNGKSGHNSQDAQAAGNDHGNQNGAQNGN